MNKAKLYDLAPLLDRVEDLQPGEKVTAECEHFPLFDIILLNVDIGRGPRDECGLFVCGDLAGQFTAVRRDGDNRC